jgi:serine protease Do
MGVARPTVAILCLGSGLAVLLAAQQPEPAANREVPDAVRAAVHRAIEKVYPALVRIHVVSVHYRQGREVKSEASGSGAIISADGHVITNHHVAGRAKRIKCTLSNKEEVEATLVGSDALADIAVVKLQNSSTNSAKAMPVAQFGNSDRVEVGDWVLAMGCPLALSQSVTLGIVSNRELMLSRFMESFRLDGEEVGSLVKWLGHDARIFPGNSGGPLVNLQGEIIGINDIGVGLGGAIPGNLARDVADLLIKHGVVNRSWLGLSVQPLLKSTKGGQGVLVSGVLPGSPAEKAGLQPGDVILTYAGKNFTIRFAEQAPEFNRAVLDSPVGKPVELVYSRGGEQHKTSVVPEARGKAEGPEAELKAWGITAQDLTLLAAKELKREPNSGVLVTSVRPGGAAAQAKPSLAPFDILIDVAGKSVRNLRDLEAVTEELGKRNNHTAPVLVTFERRTERMLTAVRIGESESPDRLADAAKAWLGVSFQVLTEDLAEALKLKDKHGIRLTEVYADQTAAKAGLKVGDVIVQLDDDPLDVHTEDDAKVFSTLIRRHRIGAKVKLGVLRDGQPMTIEARLAATPGGAQTLVEYENKLFEFRARDLQFQDRVQLELPVDQKGALITGVDGGGWAALAQLWPGDLLLEVDRRPIDDLAALKKVMKQIEEEKPAQVVFFIRRGVHTMFVELEPVWPAKATDDGKRISENGR